MDWFCTLRAIVGYPVWPDPRGETSSRFYVSEALDGRLPKSAETPEGPGIGITTPDSGTLTDGPDGREKHSV